MTQNLPSVPDRLVEMWNLPSLIDRPRDRERGSVPNRQRRAPDLLAQLNDEYSAEQVQSELVGWLQAQVPQRRAGAVLTTRYKHISHCVLRLFGSPDGPSITKALAQDIVDAFLSPYAHMGVGRVIDLFPHR